MSKWTDFLDENYCHEEYLTGNRPCDSGVLCDTCQSDAAQRMYKEYLKRFPEEVKTLEEALIVFEECANKEYEKKMENFRNRNKIIPATHISPEVLKQGENEEGIPKPENKGFFFV